MGELEEDEEVPGMLSTTSSQNDFVDHECAAACPCCAQCTPAIIVTQKHEAAMPASQWLPRAAQVPARASRHQHSVSLPHLPRQARVRAAQGQPARAG